MTNKPIPKMTEITVNAYAKINLFLDITGVLPNGYHSLNNIMQQIELYDEVKVTLSEFSYIPDLPVEKRIKITCDNPEIPTDKRNIAYKAAELFVKETELSADISIDIKKNIPVMAGLGGSSTDGAAVLKGLNLLSGSPLPLNRLEDMGASLGADVPFCIRGNAAYCKGIGEKMTDIEGLMNCYILIVKPVFSCNTAEAYKMYDKSPVKSANEPEKLLSALEKNNFDEIGKGMYNVFETLYRNDGIEKIKSDLLEYNAFGALLSGSGSAVYGLFEKEKDMRFAASELKYPIKFMTKPVFSIEKR